MSCVADFCLGASLARARAAAAAASADDRDFSGNSGRDDISKFLKIAESWVPW